MPSQKLKLRWVSWEIVKATIMDLNQIPWNFPWMVFKNFHWTLRLSPQILGLFLIQQEKKTMKIIKKRSHTHNLIKVGRTTSLQGPCHWHQVNTKISNSPRFRILWPLINTSQIWCNHRPLTFQELTQWATFIQMLLVCFNLILPALYVSNPFQLLTTTHSPSIQHWSIFVLHIRNAKSIWGEIVA